MAISLAKSSPKSLQVIQAQIAAGEDRGEGSLPRPCLPFSVCVCECVRVCVQFGRGQVLETLPRHSDMRVKVSGKFFKNSDITNSRGKQAGVCFVNLSTGTTLTDSELCKSCVTVDLPGRFNSLHHFYGEYRFSHSFALWL